VAECDWEWGGVVEATPAPCPTPVLVGFDGAPTVMIDQDGVPFVVTVDGQPLDVLVSNDSLAVTGDVGGSLEVSDTLETSVTWGLAILVFLGFVRLARAFSKGSA